MTSTSARPDDPALARRARDCLEAHLGRLTTGIVKLVVVFALLAVLSQLLWVMRVVGGVGFSRAWSGGAFGSVVRSVVSMVVVGALASVATGPLLRRSFAGTIERGVVVRARLTRPPESVLARVLGGALDLVLLDRLLGMFVPMRVANFELEFEGRTHRGITGFLYRDQTPLADDEGSGVIVLVDPLGTATRAWLVRQDARGSTT